MLSLHMGWEHVLFASWPVDPAVVARTLPDGLEPDTYEGDAYLSVVPFTNVDVRPEWLPAGVGVPLPELNLRTYVRLSDAAAAGVAGGDTLDGGHAPDSDHAGNGGQSDHASDDAPDTGHASDDAPDTGHASDDEPSDSGPTDPDAGVYFYSLDADGVAGVAGARLLHSLPYYLASIDVTETDDGVRFSSRRRHPGARAAGFAARYGPVGESYTAERGSLDSFLTDRVRYFAETSDGDLRYATVSHERWPLYDATAEIYRNDLFAANGFETPAGEPLLHYSPRVTTHASRSQPVSELTETRHV